MRLTDTEEMEMLTIMELDDILQIPPKLEPIYQPYRYKMIHGGRGSGKSESVCRFFTDELTTSKKRLLCVREIQDSLEDSVYEMFIDMIDRTGAPGWKKRGLELINTISGSKISFKGLKDMRASKNLKSYYGYDYCWIEEADAVSEESIKMLTPTIRKPGSEIWATFNRYSEFDPIYVKFCMKPDPEILDIEINWRDNPWFPEVLRKDMKRDRDDDYDLYLHVWEGHPISQIEKAVIARALAAEAVARTITNPVGMPIIGADIARFGDDRIIFYKRVGMKIMDCYVARKQDTMTTAKDLAGFAGHEYATILIDDTGVGGGVTDRLKELGFKNVVPINFASSPKDKEKYDSIISEMWFETRGALAEADIPDDKELIQELTGRLFGYDNKQRRCVEPKKKFKERYRRSPDKADALLLCFYNAGASLDVPNEIKQQIKKRRTRLKSRMSGRLIT
jgi:phage terminase large subunit